MTLSYPSVATYAVDRCFGTDRSLCGFRAGILPGLWPDYIDTVADFGNQSSLDDRWSSTRSGQPPPKAKFNGDCYILRQSESRQQRNSQSWFKPVGSSLLAKTASGSASPHLSLAFSSPHSTVEHRTADRKGMPSLVRPFIRMSDSSRTAASRIQTVSRHLSTSPMTAAPATASASTSDQSVLYESTGGARLYKLNRPKALNSLNHEMISSLTEKIRVSTLDASCKDRVTDRADMARIRQVPSHHRTWGRASVLCRGRCQA